jgi:GH24 family phage-related lysozyme (muramidase)
LADDNVDIKFGGDASGIASAAASASSHIGDFTNNIKTNVALSTEQLDKLTKSLTSVTENTKRAADAAAGLKSYADWAFVLGLVTAGYKGVAAAAQAEQTIVKAAADLTVAGIKTVANATSYGSGIIVDATTKWFKYAESLAYVTEYSKYTDIAAEGVTAWIGRQAIALEKWYKAGQLYTSGSLEQVEVSAALAGNISNLVNVFKDLGYDNVTRGLQDMSAELTKIKGLSNQDAASIVGAFANIPNITGPVLQTMVDVTRHLGLNAENAKKFANDYKTAMATSAAAGEAFVKKIMNDDAKVQEEHIRRLQERKKEQGLLYYFGVNGIEDEINSTNKLISVINKQRDAWLEATQAIQRETANIDILKTAVDKVVQAANTPTTVLNKLTAQSADLDKALSSNVKNATDLIRNFEKFSSKNYLDKSTSGKSDHQAIGYGFHQVDGQEVTTDTPDISREAAEKELANKVVEFQKKAASEVGPEWEALGQRVKDVLTSLAYNYGHVPGTVLAAAHGGDEDTIAEAVKALKANPGRREQEANYIQTGNISGLSGDALKAAQETHAKINDEITKQNDLLAGNNALQNAQNANLADELEGKKDSVVSQQRIVDALLEQRNSLEDINAKNTKTRELAQAQIKLEQDKNAVILAGLSLKTAQATSPGDRHEAEIAALKFKMKLAQEDKAQQLSIQSEITANNAAFSEQQKTQLRADEDVKYNELLKGLEERKIISHDEASSGVFGGLALLASDKQIEEQRTAIEQEHWKTVAALAEAGSKEQINANKRAAEVIANEQLIITKEIEKDNKAIYTDFNSTFQQVGNTLASSVMGMLQGTEKLSQVWKKLATSMVSDFVSGLFKMGAEFAAHIATQVALSLAGQQLQTAAVSTGTAERLGIEAGAAVAGLAAKAAAVVKSIMASAAETGAGVTGFLAPVLGPAAIGVGAASEATVAGMAALASFDIGAWSIPGDMPAMVHKGEMVMPAAEASYFRAMLTGAASGGNSQSSSVNAPVNFHIHAMDGASVETALRTNGRALMRAVGTAVHQGAHLGIRGISK